MCEITFNFRLILSFTAKYPVLICINTNQQNYFLLSTLGDVLMTQWSKESKRRKNIKKHNSFVDVTRGWFKVIIIVLSPAGCLGNMTITKMNTQTNWRFPCTDRHSRCMSYFFRTWTNQTLVHTTRFTCVNACLHVYARARCVRQPINFHFLFP